MSDVQVRDPVQDVFTQIYRTNGWGSAESVSGPGSELAVTALTRAYLRRTFDILNIRTLVDAPCGDGNWIAQITDRLDFYYGFDVVPEIIRDNAVRHTRTNHFYKIADITRDVLPRADAILCRDCFIHLPYSFVKKAINTFKASGSAYLIGGSYTNRRNIDCALGQFRPLNLEAEPFNLPPPVMRVPDPQLTNGINHENCLDRILGVWLLQDIPAFAE